MTETNIRKAFLWTMIISLSLCALIGIITILTGNWGDIELRILASTAVIGGYSLTGLCSAVLFERQRFIPLASIGMFVSVIAALISLIMIWGANYDLWRATSILMVLAIAFAHINLLLLIKNSHTAVLTAQIATILFISIVAIMVIILLLNELNYYEEIQFRILGVFAILDVLGTIVTPILNKVK
jgi:hypothetical protein